MKIPTTPWTMMYAIYRDVLPKVQKELDRWKEHAKGIPDKELRTQALTSIEEKAFHCEGGGIYGLLAKSEMDKAIRFIVAYQTISDYLDNLCDRSTSLDPEDFRALHEALLHALTPGAEDANYYRFRKEQHDGGYLKALIKTCQEVLMELPASSVIQQEAYQLANYYCDLQVYKHVVQEQRVPLLQDFFEQNRAHLPEMSWYEFSACAGSTLGIFCLVSYAANPDLKKDTVMTIKEGYFPWVQGLHILLDYFIDQEEDRVEGDLNFCYYYPNDQVLVNRFRHFVVMAEKSIKQLPDRRFHSFINKGLTAMYLADEKVQKQKKVKRTAKQIIRFGGLSALFFYVNCYVYRRK